MPTFCELFLFAFKSSPFHPENEEFHLVRLLYSPSVTAIKLHDCTCKGHYLSIIKITACNLECSKFQCQKIKVLS